MTDGAENRSLAEQVALLPAKERDSLFSDFTDADWEALQYDWKFWGRPAQFAPEGDWTICLVSAGRGFGKTRSGAEWVREKALSNPGCRIALVGRTTADVQRVMVYGESGVLAVHAPSEKPEHKISKGRLEWPNGSIAETFTSEAPSGLRGPQFDFALADELASWLHTTDDSGLNAWDNLRLATRLGKHPQILITTTPKRTDAIIDLFHEHEEHPERVAIVTGSTFDNIANLPASYLASILGKYEGTNLAAQELYAQLLTGENGALWQQEWIDNVRWLGESPWRQLPYRVVAVDPSVAENPKDECGIVVIGASKGRELHKRHAYVLEDASLLGSPDAWARQVVSLAKKYSCPVVAEGTQGQALIQTTIKSIDPSVKVLLVQTGSHGKKARAEPVTLPYQQHRVHHVGHLEDLELQLTTWDPENSKKSPDRLDALVHGITAVLINPPKGLGTGPLAARSVADRQLGGGIAGGRSRRSGMSGLSSMLG